MDYNEWIQHISNTLLKYKAKREGKLRYIDGTPTNHLCLCESEFCPHCDCYAYLPGITWTRRDKKMMMNFMNYIIKK